MGYYFCGILTGILFCVMVLLVRCAVWFEITHPEEDYWHRSAMRRDGPEKVSWLKPAGDLEDVQYQSCSQEEVDGQKIPVSVKIAPEENMRRIAPTIAGTVSSGKKAQAAAPVMSVSFFARSVKKLKNDSMRTES